MSGMIRKPILALAAALLVSGIAAAQSNVSALKGHDSKAPIDLSADRAEAQDRSDRAIFAGNVIVKQGELTLRTARLTLAYANTNGIDINRIDASGGVTVTSPSETAKGDFAVYDLNEGLITMVGNERRAADHRSRYGAGGDGRRPSRREPERRARDWPVHRTQAPELIE